MLEKQLITNTVLYKCIDIHRDQRLKCVKIYLSHTLGKWRLIHLLKVFSNVSLRGLH